jgi:hypothetical protein
MSSSYKIIEGMKAAAEGNLARITIDGQQWVRLDAKDEARIKADLETILGTLEAQQETHVLVPRLQYEALMALVEEAQNCETHRLGVRRIDIDKLCKALAALRAAGIMEEKT